jgi:NAD(P)-dependent dehydrogenase (short-subunit alcohol dehydrogenase family)
VNGAASSGTGRLRGRRALVTGGGSGIGAATASAFGKAGAAVLTGDLAGGDLVMDVRDRESVEAGISEAANRLGGLDTIVCNAGISVRGEAHELSEDAWSEVLATNLTSVFLCAKAAWPHLVSAGGGAILVTASAAGQWPEADAAGYSVTKSGAITLTRCLAFSGAKFGIRANAVCPGGIWSPMTERFLESRPDPEATRARITSLHPLGLGQESDVANAFVYLASEDARWITGTALTVDGGRMSAYSLLGT